MSGNDTTSQSTQAIGKHAEDLAARFLEQRGLRILARNFRCRGGEIDLVCRDGRALVFDEVRLRRNERFGGAGASITLRKQERVILAARHYLAAHGGADGDCRFDCVLLSGSEAKAIEWERNAFSEN